MPKRRALIGSIIAVTVATLMGVVAGRLWMNLQEEGAKVGGTSSVVSRKVSPVDSSHTNLTVVPHSPESRAKKLRAAFKSSDPLGTAAELVPLIDSLTLEDFRWLETHPDEFPVPSDAEFDDVFKEHFFNALMERWAAVDPGGVFTRAQPLEKQLQKDRAIGRSELIDALVRVRPNLILDAPEADVGRRLRALRKLASRDIVAARRYRGGFPLEELKSVDAAIARGLAQSDPLAAATVARELNDEVVFKDAVDSAARMGGDVLQRVLESGKSNLAANIDLQKLMLRYPHLPWESLPVKNQSRNGIGFDVSDDARRLAPSEREAVLARLAELPPGAGDDVATAIASEWVLRDGRAAVEWSLAHAKEDKLMGSANRPLNWAFGGWINYDAEAALAWLAQAPPSSLRDSLSCQAAAALIRKGETEAALQLFKPVPGAAGAILVRSLASVQAYRDPAAAAAWLDSLPAEVDVGKAPEPIVSEWFSKDPGAAAKWVESLPAGSRRESALQAYARAVAKRDPKLAGEWAATVSDPIQRARAAETVFREISNDDPGFAREWLRQLPGLDEHWREAVLRHPW